MIIDNIIAARIHFLSAGVWKSSQGRRRLHVHWDDNILSLLLHLPLHLGDQRGLQLSEHCSLSQVDGSADPWLGTRQSLQISSLTL